MIDTLSPGITISVPSGKSTAPVTSVVLKYYVGDKLQSPYVKNYGYVNQEKLNKILSKTKFTIASGENIYSFFSLDCINNHITIFIDKRYIKEKTEFSKSPSITL